VTMIEKVARAICSAEGIDPDRKGNETVWRWQEFEKEARAAIEAMREPTDAMREIGNWSGLPHVETYAAMIDIALKEQLS
jgi:hypothetical protein